MRKKLSMEGSNRELRGQQSSSMVCGIIKNLKVKVKSKMFCRDQLGGSNAVSVWGQVCEVSPLCSLLPSPYSTLEASQFHSLPQRAKLSHLGILAHLYTVSRILSPCSWPGQLQPILLVTT